MAVRFGRASAVVDDPSRPAVPARGVC